MKTLRNDPIDSPVERILAELEICLRQVSAEKLTEAAVLIESSSRVFVAGAGRSGLCMRAFGMRLMHLGKSAYVVGETTTPAITADSLLILGSGSGKTSSLLAIAQKTHRLGAKILLFTTDSTSPLAELADTAVTIQAPSLSTAEGMKGNQSVQPMGTLFEQSMFILCDSLIVELMQRSSVSEAQMFERHANLE